MSTSIHFAVTPPTKKSKATELSPKSWIQSERFRDSLKRIIDPLSPPDPKRIKISPSPRPDHLSMDTYFKDLSKGKDNEDCKFHIIFEDVKPKMERLSVRLSKLEKELDHAIQTKYELMAVSLLTELAKKFVKRLGLKNELKEECKSSSLKKEGHETTRYERAMETAVVKWEQAKQDKGQDISNELELTEQHRLYMKRYSLLLRARNKAAHEDWAQFAQLLLDHRTDEVSFWDPIFFHAVGKSVQELSQTADDRKTLFSPFS